MITKEQIKELTAKWKSLLDSTKKPKHVQYKFARIFEKIVEHNTPQNIKLLISITHRIFKKVDEIKSTKSAKNKILILEYDESELYEGYNFKMETVLAFIEATADMIVEEIKKVGRFSYLQIEESKLYFIY